MSRFRTECGISTTGVGLVIIYTPHSFAKGSIALQRGKNGSLERNPMNCKKSQSVKRKVVQAWGVNILEDRMVLHSKRENWETTVRRRQMLVVGNL